MNEDVQNSGPAVPKMPEIRDVSFSDIASSLRSGLSDFFRAPLFGIFFGGIFVIGGLLILISLTYFDQPWMIIPIAIGFPLAFIRRNTCLACASRRQGL